MENERGKVVVYITSLGIVREMLADCVKVRQIMRNLLIKVVEKDIFMSKPHQQELKQRLIGNKSFQRGLKRSRHATGIAATTNNDDDDDELSLQSYTTLPVPQIFVEGQYFGVSTNFGTLWNYL